LWEGLERDFPNSFIFTSEFSHIRQCIVTKKVSPNSAVPVSNLSIYCVENEETCEKEETEKLGVADLFKNMGYLHLAAFQGDLPLAYEARRLGTSVRTRNKDGFTALYFGCRTIGMWTRPRGPSNKSAAEQADDDEAMAALAAKVARVCIFLLCQYADPNETHDGVSLLHLACQSGSWDLIRALLLHGADPTPSTLGPSKHPVRFLRMEADRARFRSLASEVKNSTTGRPPCLCPCASGLPLEGCHGVPGGKPYPPEYICCCGTKRIYSACCRKRTGKAWMEEWNETGDRLVQRKVEFVESLLSPSSSEPISESEAKKRFEDAERTERQRHIQDNIIRVLGASGRIDPAYIVAIKKTGILVPS
jgi:hypothetical protein